MKTVLHKADSRGYTDHGWLKTHHTFSFSNYHNPERMNFGALRVLNDDFVKGGMGFGKHPHRDMEIITIPLEGELKPFRCLKISMPSVVWVKRMKWQRCVFGWHRISHHL